MATGHINPGYGNIVSQLDRAQEANYNNFVPGAHSLRALENVSMDRPTLEDIRKQAREAWTPKIKNQTSYQDHYAEKFSKVGEFTSSRPTSGGRINKPHPSMVFLTNRLHYCPGYHNADTTLGREPYQIDASVAPNQQSQRAILRSKFIGRPSSVALRQYRSDDEGLEFMENPLDKQVHDALIRSSNKENVVGQLHEIPYSNGISATGYLERSYRPQTVPSLHRYLKHAGVEEATKLNDIYRRYTSNYDYGTALDDLDTRRRKDMMNMVHVNTKSGKPTRRGDFLIHPEWPPSFKPHRLNGLSSVDVPYSYSTR